MNGEILKLAQEIRNRVDAFMREMERAAIGYEDAVSAMEAQCRFIPHEGMVFCVPIDALCFAITEHKAGKEGAA